MARVRIRGVPGYEDYCVLSNGQVWSLKHSKFLKPNTNHGGYQSVELFKNGKGKRLLIHRLVAQAFIPNPQNYPQVNHIDECKANNDVSNLEWCTAKYNMNYGEGAKTRHDKIDYSKPSYRENAIKNGKKVSIPVMMIKDGNIVAQFESAKEAYRQTGITQSSILRVVHGERKTAGGYKWKEVVA